MKTLINKKNSQIRITAPEIEISKLFDGSKVYWIPSIHELCGSFAADNWTLVEEEPTCKESLQVEEEHPDNFTSFEWLIGRLMFRGCDLWGMTDGEDDNGTVTKLIKDEAVEMMELLERKLDILAEPTEGIKGNLEEIPSNVDLEKEVEMEWESFNKHAAEYGEESEDVVWLNWNSFVDIATHFYKLGKKGGSK